jgi:hypothetical protein
VEVLRWLGEAGDGVVRTQVLAELFVAVTREIAAPLTVNEASERVQNLLAAWLESAYSTVTDLARLRGWSTSQPRRTAM